MSRKDLYILISLFLLVTNTASVLSTYLEDDKDPMEVTSEAETEKIEKEPSEKEFNKLEGYFPTHSDIKIISKFCLFQKLSSSNFVPILKRHLDFYLLYHSLKIAC